jgi:hypothetical protein
MRIDLPDHAGRRGDDEAAAAELPEPKAQGLTQVASESSAGGGLEQADTLNRLSKIVLAIVPALTVALAAVGSATGGLARLFRDQTGAARASIALVFLSFALAALATRTAAAAGVVRPATGTRGASVRVALLLASTALFVIGVAWAFDAQISVMGRGQAPLVTGAVKPGPSGDTVDARVVATGVKSSNRVVVWAYQSSDQNGDRNSRKAPFYYSKSGPDTDGRVDIPVVADVPNSDAGQYPYVFVTAVLGEEQRDCDGVLIAGTGPPRPNETACLTLQKPVGGQPLATRSLDVPGSVSWTDSGVSLKQGQPFGVHATGQVSFVPGGPLVGPNGAADLHPGVCVLPGPTQHAGLIGRISSSTPGTPFLVGDNFTGVAYRSGQLVLGINDTGVDNNSGSFHVSIQA